MLYCQKHSFAYFVVSRLTSSPVAASPFKSGPIRFVFLLHSITPGEGIGLENGSKIYNLLYISVE